MKLYHGTTRKIAEKAIQEGLKPRAISGHKGNWQHSVESGANRVYMTDVYALYFAIQACEEDGDEPAVLEIDGLSLSPDCLYPDEDFIEQATKAEKGLTKLARTAKFRDGIEPFQEFWKESLEHLGTVAHKGVVAPASIAKAVAVAPESNPQMLSWALDPTITILNHRFCKDCYGGITNWLFGYPVKAEQIDRFSVMDEKRKSAIEEMLSKRSGITVLK